MIQLEHTHYAPIAYDDEHYLSYLWRWATLSGARTFCRGLTALVGKAPAYLSGALTPEFLLSLVDALSPHINTNVFLVEHTQERYFKCFKAESGVVYDNGCNKYHCTGRKTERDFSIKHLRWCHACAREDAGRYGLAYWHNSHQDSRIVRCQRHGLKLLSTCQACKRNKVYLSQISTPPVEAICQYCQRQLDNKCKLPLTDFQYWLESLHHLANHGVHLNRESFVLDIRKIVDDELDSMPSMRRRSTEGPQRRFIEAYNESQLGAQIGTGDVAYEILKHYQQLRLNYLLKKDILLLPEMYALLGWVFLPEDERNARFGVFRYGQAVQEAA
tara:strand:- start:2242 stop:3231 length:990 start_codon:yes stop_codon:yes gene_type:complete